MDHPDPEIDKAARIIAVRCRTAIQGLLMDSERNDCDREFARIVREVLDELATFKGK